jgi:hypothetical protein
MSRKDRRAYAEGSGIFGLKPQGRAEDGSEDIPDKVCGICKHYRESAYFSDGRGSCNILREGSDILSTPPVFNLEEGKDGYMLRILTDASKCKYYEKSEFVDKDGLECSDPVYRRSMRQLKDK